MVHSLGPLTLSPSAYVYSRNETVPADCRGTTCILIMGPIVVGLVSAKLSTLMSLSLAMFRKLSLRSRNAGESGTEEGDE